jgi:hypothetical protein
MRWQLGFCVCGERRAWPRVPKLHPRCGEQLSEAALDQ